MRQDLRRPRPGTAKPTVESLEGRQLLARSVIAAPPALVQPSTPAPTITQARVVRVPGFGAVITLTFSHPMYAATVASAQNYTVTDVTKRSKSAFEAFEPVVSAFISTKQSKPVGLRYASYDPATMTVTLVPVQGLNPLHTYQVGSVAPTARNRGHIQPLTDSYGVSIKGGKFLLQIVPGRVTKPPQK